jgi:hypothetical protein
MHMPFHLKLICVHINRIFLQSLDEADIALLKSYGQGQYTKAIKVSTEAAYTVTIKKL